MVLRVIAVIVATAVPDVGPMISLVGSVGFSVLGLLVPTALETVWYWEPKSEEDFDEMDDVELEDVIGLASAAALTSRNDNSQIAKRKIAARRALRHLKNFSYVILALSALAGGTFYNLKEMFALASNHT